MSFDRWSFVVVYLSPVGEARSIDWRTCLIPCLEKSRMTDDWCVEVNGGGWQTSCLVRRRRHSTNTPRGVCMMSKDGYSALEKIRSSLRRLGDDSRGGGNENVGEKPWWKKAEVVVEGQSHSLNESGTAGRPALARISAGAPVGYRFPGFQLS